MIKKIQISADVSSVKTSLKELDRSLSDVARQPHRISLFDKKDKDSLKKWAKSQIPGIQKEIDKLRQSMTSVSDINLLINTKREAFELEKMLKRMERISLGKISTPSTRQDSGGVLGRMGGIAGGMALGGMGLLAGATIGRGYQAYSQRMQEVPSRLSLAGSMGVDRYEKFTEQGGPYEGRKYGFDVNETLSLANQLVREVGNVRGIGTAQRAARAYALDPTQLSSTMGMLRRTTGQTNVEKNFAGLLGSAVASNLDQGLLAEYMSSTAQFVEQIATEGTADAREIARSVSGLVRQGGLLQDTQRTTRALGSLNESIKGATGARFGFFAQSFEKMLGSQATGSQVLLNLGQGLFGPDTSRLTALSPEERQQLGGPGFSERAGAITGQFGDLTKGMDVPSKALVAKQLTGIKDAAEAFNFMNALKQGKFTEEELSKKYQEALSSPEEKALRDLNRLVDTELNRVSVKSTENLSKLGERLAPGIGSIKDTLLDIEEKTLLPLAKGVSELVKHFTGKTETLKTVTETIGDVVTGAGKTKAAVQLKGAVDPLFQLQTKDENKELRGSLSRLYNPYSEQFSGEDVERIKGESTGFNKMQKETVQKRALEKVMSSTLEIARGRKEGIPVEGESGLLESIRQARKLVPEDDSLARKRSTIIPAVTGVMKEEGLEEIFKQIERETTGGKVLQFPQMKTPSVPGSQETPRQTQEKETQSKNSELNIDKLAGSMDKLTRALDSNTNITNDNTKATSTTHNINQFRARTSPMATTSRRN